ncbi:MAG: hypothetical protein M1587_04505 [Thaumarchaeota archaeon]|nr:hypothetical protein [Nitrososphaerota archaeon]
MALAFDLNSSMRSHVIDGVLYDSSNANLAADMEYLESLFRTAQLVWVDATDQYQALCAFGKIAKLQGPTVDSSTGQYVANFTMEFWSLPPWGTMQFNPWRQTGFKMRDIDGFGAEYTLDPSQMHCNYSLGEIGQTAPYSLSWEFILDNQNAFSGSQFVINECENTTDWVSHDGTSLTFSNDTFIFKQGTASLKCSGTPNSGGTLGFDYSLSTPITLASYDFIVCWVRSDFGGNSAGSFQIYLLDANGYYSSWIFTCNANEWYRLVMPINSPTNTSGTLNIASITEILVQATGSTSASNVWIDEIAGDIGNWVRIEAMLPDNVSESQTPTSIQIYSWDGAVYDLVAEEGAQGDNATVNETAAYSLAGSNFGAYYPSTEAFGIFVPGSYGTTQALASGSDPDSSLTYQSNYGPQNRFAFSVKMPPATSDSASGNVPSDDLSGFQAINKMRIKVVVKYSNDDTTYTGFNSL